MTPSIRASGRSDGPVDAVVFVSVLAPVVVDVTSEDRIVFLTGRSLATLDRRTAGRIGVGMEIRSVCGTGRTIRNGSQRFQTAPERKEDHVAARKKEARRGLQPLVLQFCRDGSSPQVLASDSYATRPHGLQGGQARKSVFRGLLPLVSPGRLLR